MPTPLRPLHLAGIALAASLLAAPSRAQAVLRVDDFPGPGVDFTDLQAAVDASVPGGLLLLGSGSFEAFTLVGKSLDLVHDADDGPAVIVGASLVEGLDVSQQVRLSGLTFDGQGAASGLAPLRVEECAGPVLIDRCSLLPSEDIDVFGAVLQYGLYARRAERLVVSSSVAGRAVDVPNLHGLYARKSTAALFDCTTFGGMGIAASDGYPGATGDESTFTLAGGQHAGGMGAPSFTGVFGGCTGPGDGAAGFSLEGAFGSLSTGRALGFAATGGAAGSDLAGTCPPAFAGPPTFADPFSLLQINPVLSARRQSFAPVADGGADVDVSFSGEPADLAWLLVSARADLRPAGVDYGATPLGVGPTPLVVSLGALDASGALEVALGTPQLPAGAAATLVTQPVMLDPALNFVLGNPLTITLLGPGL